MSEVQQGPVMKVYRAVISFAADETFDPIREGRR